MSATKQISRLSQKAVFYSSNDSFDKETLCNTVQPLCNSVLLMNSSIALFNVRILSSKNAHPRKLLPQNHLRIPLQPIIDHAGVAPPEINLMNQVLVLQAEEVR